MKSSSSLSATATPPSPARSPRKAFALTGPSVVLDPLTHAVRPDLADIRLAEYVFAPHYAQAVRCTINRSAAIMELNGAPAGELAAGDRFEVLDLVGTRAWGVAPDANRVGYVDQQVLDWPE